MTMFLKLLLAQVNVNEERTVHVNCTVSPNGPYAFRMIHYLKSQLNV